MKDENRGERHAVWSVICDGKWRTLAEIRAALDGEYSEAGISARLRDFRKAVFGRHTIESRHRAGAARTYEYRLLLPDRREHSRAEGTAIKRAEDAGHTAARTQRPGPQLELLDQEK